MIPRGSYWITLIQSLTPLAKYTILPSHYALLHHGFMRVMMQSYQRRLEWLKDFKLNGENVFVQSLLALHCGPFHAGVPLLQLA